MNHDPSAVTDDDAEGLAELGQDRSGVDASGVDTGPAESAVEPEGPQGSELELELELEVAPVGRPDDEPAATPAIEPDADALDAEPVAAEALERELTPGGQPEPQLADDEPPLEYDVEVVGLEAALAVPAVVPVDQAVPSSRSSSPRIRVPSVSTPSICGSRGFTSERAPSSLREPSSNRSPPFGRSIATRTWTSPKPAGAAAISRVPATRSSNTSRTAAPIRSPMSSRRRHRRPWAGSRTPDVSRVAPSID